MTSVKESDFWHKVHKTDTCWIWLGYVSTDGYGWVRGPERKNIAAHRISYESAFGRIPYGQVIDHVCHVKSCVNPDHLRAATQKRNAENRNGANANSKSGIRGVFWHKGAKKWTAAVRDHGDDYNLGYFSDKREAEAAVIAKRLEIFTHNDLDRPGVAAIKAPSSLSVSKEIQTTQDLLSSLVGKVIAGGPPSEIASISSAATAARRLLENLEKINPGKETR